MFAGCDFVLTVRFSQTDLDEMTKAFGEYEALRGTKLKRVEVDVEMLIYFTSLKTGK